MYSTIQFKRCKSIVEGIINQIPKEELRNKIGGKDNSVAIIMKHLSGNLISRFTEFLNSDSEKEWPHRDNEPLDDFKNVEALVKYGTMHAKYCYLLFPE